MKIRTRLLLFLLPTFIGSIALISSLLAYNWYRDIASSLQNRLNTAVLAAAALIEPEELHQHRFTPEVLEKHLEPIRQGFAVNRLYFIPIHHNVPFEIVKTELHTTPIYRTSDGEKLMSAYVPISNAYGHLIGHVAADIDMSLLDQKFRESLFQILLSASLTILVVVTTLFIIANKISRPIQKLNNSALAIAAGHYGESIFSEGPKEVVELSNTLNTMSECLQENIRHLKERSLLRERMYGEYECSMLLQHLMLQKNIEDCRSDVVAIKPITFFSDNPKGLLLDFPKSEGSNSKIFHIQLVEAREEGFQGMYHLLTQPRLPKAEIEPCAFLTIDRSASTLSAKGSTVPTLWSFSKKRFSDSVQEILTPIEPGDFFFLFNEGFAALYQGQERREELLGKVLNVFAQEGLETTAAMLQKEMGFAIKRKRIEADLHLLCFQVLHV